MGYCSKCGNKLEEGEDYCPECGQPIRKTKAAAGNDQMTPPRVQGATRGDGAEHRKKILTILAAINMALSIFAALFIFAPWLTGVMQSGVYTGLALDYSGLGFATGVFTIAGYTFIDQPALVYWMIIVPAIACSILSLATILSLYLKGGKRNPIVMVELIFVAVSIVGIFLGYDLDLQFRLGFIDLGGGNTAFRVIGWGFIGEIVLFVSLLIVLVSYDKMQPDNNMETKRPAGAERKLASQEEATDIRGATTHT